MNSRSDRAGAHGPGPHGRPRRPADVRTRLLDAAEALVAELRPAAITARDLARAADCADGALYNHFGGKHDLLVAALARRFHRLLAELRAEVDALSNDTDREAGLERVALAALRFHQAALPMLGNVLSEPALFHRLMVEIHRSPDGGRAVMDAVGGVLARTADQRTVPAATDLLVGAILLIALTDALQPHPDADHEGRVRAAVGVLRHGLDGRADASD